MRKQASSPFTSDASSYYFYSKLRESARGAVSALTRLGPEARVAWLVAAAVLGGYALTAAWVALLAALLPAAGMAQSEAVVLSAMLGYVIYLLVLLWAFSLHSLPRLGALLIGGTSLASGLVALMRWGA